MSKGGAGPAGGGGAGRGLRPVAAIGPGAGWPRRVRAVTTTRIGGLGTGAGATAGMGTGGGDDPAIVAANRRRLARLLDLPGAPLWIDQVHGTDVVELPAAASGNGEEGPRADAAWTGRPGVVCAVLTADCLPIVLAAADGRAVAVIHAGWRGLAAGVIGSAVTALPVPAGELHAWLGPAIGPRAFEVGPEVRAAFVDGDAASADAFRPGRGDRWFADLYVLARQNLRVAGVEWIDGGGRCTFSEADRFFSHRRDGGRTGRMATLAWLEPG